MQSCSQKENLVLGSAGACCDVLVSRFISGWALVVVVSFVLFGCTWGKDQPFIPAPPAAPAYGDLVNRYNANIEGFSRMWSKDTMVIRGHKEGGGGKDNVDANIYIKLPDDFALVADKFGNRIFWAGSNKTHYWLFEFEDDKAKKLSYGRHDKLNPRTAERYPLPIHPRQLPSLLGLLPIDPELVPEGFGVESYPKGFVIEPPGTNTRMLLDHETALPKRIDLIDEEGGREIVCLLGKHKRLGDDSGPLVPTRVTIKLVGRTEEMDIKLGRLSTRKKSMTDLDRLIRAFPPEVIIDLDE